MLKYEQKINSKLIQFKVPSFRLGVGQDNEGTAWNTLLSHQSPHTGASVSLSLGTL